MAEVGLITLPPGVSPGIVDAVRAHHDATIIERFTATSGSETENEAAVKSSRNLERFAFRQLVFSQCHTDDDVTLKLWYMRTCPAGRENFISALLNQNRGGDLAEAFLRSLLITEAGKKPPVLPQPTDQLIVRFLQNACVITGRDADRVAAMELYRAYVAYAQATDAPELNDQIFLKGLQPMLEREWPDKDTGASHRFWRQRSNQGYFYRGICLKAGRAGRDWIGSLSSV